MMRFVTIALVLACCGAGLAQQNRETGDAPAATARKLSPAEIRSDMLDRLFARLHQGGAGPEATATEAQIWKIWMTSDSATAQALIDQATRAMSAKELDAALKILDGLIEAHPDFAEAWNKRATLYFMQDKFAESLADIAKVLELEPRHFGALAGLGMIKDRQGETEAALVAYRAALAVNPNMPGVTQALKDIEKRFAPI